jgi:hypothetical protein
MSDTVITKENIEDRKKVIANDIATVTQRLTENDKKKLEDTALLNALNGALQQCDLFLEGLNDEKPEMAGDDGNDESSVDEE